jgi:hypothetical protein
MRYSQQAIATLAAASATVPLLSPTGFNRGTMGTTAYVDSLARSTSVL